MNDKQTLPSFDEDTEINDDDLEQEPEMKFYATGNDGKVIKLHDRIASVPISFGGKEFQKLLEEEMKDYDDEEIMALAPFEIIGRGIAGIDEMAATMDDSRVFFGLLQIQIGEGTFARYKNIFIHFQGEKMKILPRARANKRLAVAKELIGHAHAPLVVSNKDQFTVGFVFNELKRIFTADNIAYKGKGKQTDINTLRINYQQRMERAKMEADEERKRLIQEKLRLEKEAKQKAIEEEQEKLLELQREAARKKRQMEEEKKRIAEEERRIRHEREEKERLERLERKRIKEEEQQKILQQELEKNPNTNIEQLKQEKKKGKKKKRRKSRKKKDNWSDNKPWTGERVLACIHAQMSPFNWGLFKPSQKDIKPIIWGHGSLNELRAHLKDDQVMYGIMRLSFGADRFRRSHWIYFLWTPDTMSMVHKKNGKRMKHVSYNGDMQQLLSPWTISLTVECKEKVTITDWIMRVKRTVVVDGGDELFSEEAFKKALQEENKYIGKLKEKEKETMAKLKQEQEIQKVHEMKEATRKRKEKADKKQNTVFTKVQLKQVLNSPIKIDASQTPTVDKDGNFYVNHEVDYAAIQEQKEKEEELKKNEREKKNKKDSIVSNDSNITEEEYWESSNSDSEKKAREESPEPVIELSAEEIAVIEQERQKKEEEQRAKMLENEIKYRKVLQSKMVLESVELVKRTSEKLCWILFAPRTD